MDNSRYDRLLSIIIRTARGQTAQRLHAAKTHFIAFTACHSGAGFRHHHADDRRLDGRPSRGTGRRVHRSGLFEHWLINGICSGSVYGFSVQTAQAIGARNNEEARNCSRQGLLVILGVAFLIGSIGFGLSGMVPVWLGGEDAILADASAYLGIFCLCLPFSPVKHTGDRDLAGGRRYPAAGHDANCHVHARRPVQLPVHLRDESGRSRIRFRNRRRHNVRVPVSHVARPV